MNKPITRQASQIIIDCSPVGEKHLAEVEKAYRRGFHQGAYEAFCQADMTNELGVISDAKCDRWIRKVYTWRLKASKWVEGQLVKCEFPPM